MQIQHEWFDVAEIGPQTYAISEWGHWEKVHSFLLIGDNKAVLIDTGLGIANIKEVTDQLTSLPIEVITSHVHTDHIGSHASFDNIFLHAEDRNWLENGIQGPNLEQIRFNLMRDITKEVPEAFDINEFYPYQGEAKGLLIDGQWVELGNRSIRIIHTPGHSPGHISIWDQLTGFLFTGDVLYLETPIYAFYPSTDPVLLINSWKKFLTIKGVTRLFGSHNQLGFDIEVLEDVKTAIDYLEQNDLVKWGTGLHSFKHISVQF